MRKHKPLADHIIYLKQPVFIQSVKLEAYLLLGLKKDKIVSTIFFLFFIKFSYQIKAL